MAAGGQERELLLHGALELPAGAAEQRPVAAVEAELAAVGAHEVEDRAEPLARRAAQAPAELLEEQRGALRGAQHEHGVDGGYVDALVEQVDREHRAAPPESLSAPLSRRVRRLLVKQQPPGGRRGPASGGWAKG